MAVEGVDKVTASLQKWVDGQAKAAEGAMRDVVSALEEWARAEYPGRGKATIRGEVAEAGAEIVRGMIAADMSAESFQKLVRSGKWSWLWPVLLKHEADILKIIASRLGSSSPGGSAGGTETVTVGSDSDDGDAKVKETGPQTLQEQSSEEASPEQPGMGMGEKTATSPEAGNGERASQRASWVASGETPGRGREEQLGEWGAGGSD